MSVPHALLGLLERAPRHGYELKQRFDALFSPTKPLAFGQVYATLGRLERDGHVAVTGVERADGPDRKRYALTDGGARELARWLGTPLAPQPHLQAAIYTKVVVAILDGQPLEPLLDAQRHAHLARMRELTAIRRTAPFPTALLADYGLFHLEADLRWLELTAARLDDLRAQVHRADAPDLGQGQLDPDLPPQQTARTALPPDEPIPTPDAHPRKDP